MESMSSWFLTEASQSILGVLPGLGANLSDTEQRLEELDRLEMKCSVRPLSILLKVERCYSCELAV